MNQLDTALVEWVEECCGQPVDEAVRIPGGASRQAWVVTLADGARRFLRMDSGDSALSAVGYSLAREAQVYEWLTDTPVRAAGFCGVSPDGRALLLDFVEGAPGPLDNPELAREFMEQVTALHALEPPDHLAHDDLAVWTRAYRSTAPSPTRSSTSACAAWRRPRPAPRSDRCWFTAIWGRATCFTTAGG